MTFNIKASIGFTDFKANTAFHHNFKAFKAHFLYKGKQKYILYVYPFIKKKKIRANFFFIKEEEL